MYFSSIIIIPLLAASTQAALNGHCSKDGSGQEGYTGICLYTSTCNAYAGGYYVDGLCPNDPSDSKYPPQSFLISIVLSAAKYVPPLTTSPHTQFYPKAMLTLVCSAVRCCFVDNCDPNTGGFIESYCDWTSHACPNQGSFHSGKCCSYLLISDKRDDFGDPESW
jgi:hypothetical protein